MPPSKRKTAGKKNRVDALDLRAAQAAAAEAAEAAAAAAEASDTRAADHWGRVLLEEANDVDSAPPVIRDPLRQEPAAPGRREIPRPSLALRTHACGGRRPLRRNLQLLSDGVLRPSCVSAEQSKHEGGVA